MAEMTEKLERVNNDMYGNPRYVVHYLALNIDYDEAKKIAHAHGGKVYRAKTHGGCFVFTTYEPHQLAKDLKLQERRIK